MRGGTFAEVRVPLAVRPAGVAIAVFAVLTVFLTTACSVGSRNEIPDRPFMKGVAFTGYWSTAYQGQAPLLSLDALRTTDAGWISILVTAYQMTIDSTEIDFTGERTPTDESVGALVNYARSAGLKVMLKPHVDLEADPEHYRGQIGSNFSESGWQAWFAAYEAFIIHYAALAESLNCEVFCAGCELGGTAGRAGEWRSIISGIREIYHGKLVYADNLAETNPDAVTWWDELDYIGQDVYPTLSQEIDPTEEELRLGWSYLVGRLSYLSERWQLPVILTEIGCRSVLGGAINPWDWQKTGPPDMEIQKKYYQAAFQALTGRDWLQGMFWWQWLPDPDHGGLSDTGYSPHGKPAEAVLKTWYGREL